METPTDLDEVGFGNMLCYGHGDMAPILPSTSPDDNWHKFLDKNLAQGITHSERIKNKEI